MRKFRLDVNDAPIKLEQFC